MTKPHDAALFSIFIFYVLLNISQKAKARIKQINDLRAGTDGDLYGFHHFKPPFLIFSHGKRIIFIKAATESYKVGCNLGHLRMDL